MGNVLFRNKDGTAQGVAKARHYEALLPPEKRLYYDPYAYAMFPGSCAQVWMGTDLIDKICRWMGLVGFLEMMSVRTRWLDEGIGEAIVRNGAKQVLILGAGYDTRGFRLDLPEEIKVYEVDQPEVQAQKISNLNWLKENMKDNEEAKKKITDRMNSQVQFVEVDFNKDSLKEKLQSHEGFEPNQPTVVLMEGVTQYIPKEATADTLRKLKTLVAKGSTLLITYVDQNTFDHPELVAHDPKWSETIVKSAGRVGEPWISGWTQKDFSFFLKECGYGVVSNTTVKDYNEFYLEPLGRKLDETELVGIERFVKATLL